jgi:hypothetical protein
MNKKGFFFWWGSETKRELIAGIYLSKPCECKSKRFNVEYELERGTLFSIPLGGWSADKIESIHIQCIKCGHIYGLDEPSYKHFKELYKELQEK